MAMVKVLYTHGVWHPTLRGPYRTLLIFRSYSKWNNFSLDYGHYGKVKSRNLFMSNYISPTEIMVEQLW
jgi:hypothetical protein